MSKGKIAYHILRVGLAVTFVWIGIMIFQESTLWGAFLRPWAAGLLPIPLKAAMLATAALDITVGFFLLINRFVWLAASVGAFHIMLVLATTGITAITIRDIGLLSAALALAINYWPDWLTLRNHPFKLK